MELTVAVHFLDTFEEIGECVTLNRKQLRDNSNVLELPTNRFIANFRVLKDIFSMLLKKYLAKSTPSYRSTYIRSDIKLATVLRFLATGSYQETVGNEILSSLSKPSVSRIIREWIDFFETDICDDWIQMVAVEEECKIKQSFFEAFGFPGIIGCVDGTHIKIKSPGDDVKHLYYNRKGYYSINAMVICDNKTRIMYVDARHPGANHDAFVWEHGIIDQELKERFESGLKNTWILGDAGYKLKPFLMTPFRNPSNADERRYNKKHCSARNVVERCFGVLKNRFRCIIGSRGLHYNPEKVTKIVNACCALHNMCLHYKCLEPDIVIESNISNEDEELQEQQERDLGAVAIRRSIAMSL